MDDYQVGLISKFHMVQSDDSLSLQLHFNDIQQLDSPRKEWDAEHLKEGLVWVAGGGSYLINDQFLLLVKRSPSAPSNAGKLTIPTGLSDNQAEWKNPDLLKRELFEEVVFLDQTHKRFFWPAIDSSSEKIIHMALKDTSYENYQSSPIESYWIEEISQDLVIVEDEHQSHHVKGLIHLNQNHINVLWCCSIKLAKDFNRVISFIDTEYIVLQGKKSFLEREVCFYDLNNEIILNANLTQIESTELTSHAKYLIEKLKPKRRKND